jgi:Tol biopolymer transport system component
MNSAPREALMPLALAFIEQQVGTGSVTRMIPGIRSSRALGDLIGKTLGVDPATLEPAWQSYLRQQAGLSPTAGLAPSPPSGELAMSCATDNTGTSSIWRMHTDGTGLTQIIPDVQMVTIISWSPDGRLLAYAHGNYVSIMDWDTERVMTVPVQGFPSWLPNQPGAVSGRLTVADFFSDSPADKRVAHVVDPNTGLDIAITGTYHVWSPDGMQLAYSQADDIIRIADANGFQARQTVQGLAPTWSPDGKRLAYWSSRRLEKMGEYTRTVAADVQVLDVESGAVATLARWDELLPPSQATGQDQGPSGLAWSPDGLSLAVGIAQRNNPPVFILDANTGEVRIRQVGQLVPLPFLRVWSPDSRYLILWVTSNSPSEDNRGELDALDMNTGQTRPLSSAGLWDWSPDGQWLAVAQLSEDKGVWLVTPDLSSIRQLAERMNCVSVAWRPKH